jgi:hypothetical protein
VPPAGIEPATHGLGTDTQRERWVCADLGERRRQLTCAALLGHGWGTAAPLEDEGRTFPHSHHSGSVQPSHRPDEHHHSQQQPRRYPSLALPPALGSTPPAVQSAPRVGTVVRSWSTARGTGAAQTVGNEATSPSPMDQDPPAMLGKRTTQALVAQGIEHRFPKPCVAGSNPAGGTTTEQQK